jgi:hypothetical protein
MNFVFLALPSLCYCYVVLLVPGENMAAVAGDTDFLYNQNKHFNKNSLSVK